MESSLIHALGRLSCLSRRTASALLCLSLLLLSFHGHAAPVPGGSWQKSCKNASMSGTQLGADCKTGTISLFGGGNGWRYTIIQRTDLCSGDLSNDHGRLKCNRGIYTSSLPASANKTCDDVFRDKGVLYAMCRKKSGGYRTNALFLQTQCLSAVNNDGTLSCSTAPPACTPTISAVAANKGFIVHGSCFLPNHAVYFRYVDNNLKNVFGQGSANAAGSFDFNTGAICVYPGPVAISANDGRSSSSDVTGTLWSNTVVMTCP
ncbi:hypothetical protein [Xanthomonas sacchari]|uniref:Cyanovirin-N domain-containing protein n=2 Tax=Xanthomonas sacchari TaxID=56458 RepID=A0A2P5Z590_9XANT|nr:hypothetical protein [Xanthomonas sacchari]MDV0438221.1 hypothetical protein [Xanthomonas sacchari]PPU83113.1 hypothetical protein XsacCFBP4641_08030 [Xanthomonas sacchari]